MIVENKDLIEKIKYYLKSKADITHQRARKIAYELEELEMESEKRKIQVADRQAKVQQQIIHANNVRMLQQLLSEANNCVPTDIRVSSFLPDKSLRIEYDEATRRGSTELYVGKRLDRYTVSQYKEGIEVSLKSINEDTLNDFSDFIIKEALDWQLYMSRVIMGDAKYNELAPLTFWNRYTSYHKSYEHNLIELQIIDMSPTPTGVKIIFTVLPVTDFNLRWWAIDSVRYVQMFNEVANGYIPKSAYLWDKENINL